MSNELKKIVKAIQFRTDKTIEEIAKEVGYARAYFTNQVNIGTNKKLKDLLLDKFPINNEQNVLYQEPPGLAIVSEPQIDYNRTLPLGGLKVTLKDYVDLLTEKAEKAEQEKNRLYNIIEGYLKDIHSNSKEIADDISALTDEVQAEHRAMMDSIDVAAKQPIGTTAAKADSVELASQEERVGKGKKVVGKPGKQA